MIIENRPYFLENEEWYTVDYTFSSPDGRGYHLTDKAPKEAVESYNEFYASKTVEIDGEEYEVM